MFTSSCHLGSCSGDLSLRRIQYVCHSVGVSLLCTPQRDACGMTDALFCHPGRVSLPRCAPERCFQHDKGATLSGAPERVRVSLPSLPRGAGVTDQRVPHEWQLEVLISSPPQARVQDLLQSKAEQRKPQRRCHNHQSWRQHPLQPCRGQKCAAHLCPVENRPPAFLQRIT